MYLIIVFTSVLASMNPLSAGNIATSLANEYLNGFPAPDQDTHTENLRDHLVAWLSSTAYTLTPTIADLMDEEDVQQCWKYVLFLSADSIHTCLKRWTSSRLHFIFYGQLFGLIGNGKTCPTCEEPCTLRHRVHKTRNQDYWWRCRRQSHGETCATEISIFQDSWFSGVHEPGQLLDVIVLHLLRVPRARICSLVGCDSKTYRKWIQDLQMLCDDMLTTVKVSIREAADVDAMYLSAHNKFSYGREMGAQDRYKENTLIDCQQRGSQRYSVLVTDAHENATAADQLVTATVEKKTDIFTDGGHGPASAWLHFEDILECCRKTVNHSKWLKDPNTGMM